MPQRIRRTARVAYTPFRMEDIPSTSQAQNTPGKTDLRRADAGEQPVSVADLVARVHSSRNASADSTARPGNSGHRTRSMRVSPVGIGAVIAGASITGACSMNGAGHTAHGAVTAVISAEASDAASTTGPLGDDFMAVVPRADFSGFLDQLSVGAQFSQERERQAAAGLRPLYSAPAFGTFTSGFGYRWGTLHAGADIAGAYGSPISAVADGTVVEAGPASGFGQWIRIRHDDGTITVYGHISAIYVHAGQRVLTGDRIAGMGNLGFSTGTHLHLEVWLNGKNKVDPVRWLAARGVRFDGTPYTGGAGKQ